MRLLLLALILLAGCTQSKLEPELHPSLRDKELRAKASPFPPLKAEEKETFWGKEYMLGKGFGKEHLEFYEALTSFKRARILLEDKSPERKSETEYFIILSYYLGGKYADVISTFNSSSWRNKELHDDLLLMLYDSYLKTKQGDKADQILSLIAEPSLKERIETGALFQKGDVQEINKKEPGFVKEYENEKKSEALAQTLNALLPGSGFLYLGEKQTALTSFLVNGLFILAAYELFHHKHVAAGIIVTSLEAGWYFGGIYGAGQNAKLHNERLFEKKAQPFMQEKKLFPLLNLSYAF